MYLLMRTSLSDNQSAGEGAVATKRSRRGATLMEYLMMVSLIIVVCLVAIGSLGTTNNANMSTSSNAINKSLKKGG